MLPLTHCADSYLMKPDYDFCLLYKPKYLNYPPHGAFAVLRSICNTDAFSLMLFKVPASMAVAVR